MIKRYLQAALYLLFLSFVVVQAQVVSLASAQEGVQIWNPKKVDWWVSLDDQVHQGVKQGCEIHWLYDDVLDVALNVSNKGRLYYSFEVTNGGRDFAIDYNQADAAFLVIDKVKNPLAIAKGNFSKVMMALPSDLNNLQNLQDARRLLISIRGTLYNFPLENGVENFSYFKQCLDKLNVSVITSTASSVVRRAPVKSVFIEPKKLPTLSRPPVEAVADVLPVQVPSVEQAPSKQVKQFDGILKDAQYSGILDQKSNALSENFEDEKSSQGNDLKSPNSCPEAEYSEHNTGVIRNLTKKLAVLEREKEELRAKVFNVSGNEILREVSNCKTPEDENLDEPLSDELIEKFKDTINKLRAENELLKEASLQAEEDEADAGLLEDETDKLRQKISDLLRANEGLSEENDSLQEQIQSLENSCQATDKIEENFIDSTISTPTVEADDFSVDSEGASNSADIDLEALAAENKALIDRFEAITGTEIPGSAAEEVNIQP